MVDELYHYGVLGMKWGVRRQRSSSSNSGGKRPRKGKKQSQRKKVRSMTNQQIQKKIRRMEMEKRYLDLHEELYSPGKKFIKNILRTQGSSVAGDAVRYAMGSAVNKATGRRIVNVGGGKKKK